MIKNNVINVLRNEYEEWILSLTDAEIKAIRKYSYNSMDSKPNRFFERLNAMLRGDYNRNDKEMLKEYADIISSALCRHPLEHDIICYRGTDVDPTLNIKTGTIFTFDQFISTSVVKNKALKRKYLYMIKAVEGTKGAYIEKISAFPKQREFLLDSTCKYRLKSRYQNQIRLEVIV